MGRWACPSAHLPICPSAHLPFCPSAHLPHRPICPSAHLPICPSAHLPICPCPSAHAHLPMPICPCMLIYTLPCPVHVTIHGYVHSTFNGREPPRVWRSPSDCADALPQRSCSFCVCVCGLFFCSCLYTSRE